MFGSENRRARWLLVVLCLFAAGPAVSAQDDWKGKTVYIKKTGLRMMSDAVNGKRKVVARLERYAYLVVEEKDGWLRLPQNGVEGWVRKSDMVPHKNAVAHYNDVLRKNPNNSNLIMARAQAYQTAGKFEEAKKDYDEAIRLRPKSGAVYNNRANLWLAMKKADKAVEDFTKAIQYGGNNWALYSNRGVAWQTMKQYDKAIADYDRALQLNAKAPITLRNRGVAWLNKREFDKAIGDFTKALTVYPRFADAVYKRGLAWKLKKQIDKARQDFKHVLTITPRHYLAFHELGRLAVDEKKYADAIKLFDKALQANPKYTSGLNSLAWLLATCPEAKYRDGKRAVQLAKTACELTKHRITTYVDTLAAAHAEAGQFKEAVWWQERVLMDEEFRRKHRRGALQRLKLYRNKKAYQAK